MLDSRLAAGDDDEDDSEDEELVQQLSQPFGPFVHPLSQLSMFNHQFKLNLAHFQNLQQQFGGIGAAAAAAAAAAATNSAHLPEALLNATGQPLNGPSAITNTTTLSTGNNSGLLHSLSPNSTNNSATGGNALLVGSHLHDAINVPPMANSHLINSTNVEVSSLAANSLPAVPSNNNNNNTFNPDDYYQYLQALRKNWLLNQTSISGDAINTHIDTRPSASSDDLDRSSSTENPSSSPEDRQCASSSTSQSTHHLDEAEVDELQVDVDGDDVIIQEDVKQSSFTQKANEAIDSINDHTSNLICSQPQLMLNFDLLKQIMMQKSNQTELNEMSNASKRQKFDMDSLLNIESHR